MSLNVLLCDDEEIVIKDLSNSIKAYWGSSIELFCFCNSSDVMQFLGENRNHAFDTAIMDIKLENENGIDLANFLQHKFPELRVIFITGYPDYVPDMFLKLKPYGYLPKPIKHEILHRHLENIQKELLQLPSIYDFSVNGVTISLSQTQICYLESDRAKLKIHTTNGDYITYEKLDNAEQVLDSNFIRCHKSYIVNLNYVKELQEKLFLLFTGELIPISRAKASASMESYFKKKGGVT